MFGRGFKGLRRIQVDGSDFEASFAGDEICLSAVGSLGRRPYLVHAQVPCWSRTSGRVGGSYHRSAD